MPLLKRVIHLRKSLEQTQASGSSDGSVARRPSSADFSLQKSALSRTIGWHVGRGASSGLLQEVASAAVAEAGHLCREVANALMLILCACKSCTQRPFQGIRWAATLGASGRRAQHIEERLSKAVSSSKSDVAGLN